MAKHRSEPSTGGESAYAINQSTKKHGRKDPRYPVRASREDTLDLMDGWRGSRIQAGSGQSPSALAKGESSCTKTMEHAPVLVQVETYADQGVEKLRRIRFDSRQIEIAENIDQWHGPDYRYFKVRGTDGNLYMLRHNEIRATWELTMYEFADAAAYQK